MKPLPLRYGGSQEGWQQEDGWKQGGESSPAQESGVVSEGGDSGEENQAYTPATSPPSNAATPPTAGAATGVATVKKNGGKRNKSQVICNFLLKIFLVLVGYFY